LQQSLSRYIVNNSKTGYGGNDPRSKIGRTLVPLRAIFEALGAELNWDPVTRTVTGTKDGTVVTLTIDSKNRIHKRSCKGA